MYVKNSIKFKWRRGLENPLLEIIVIEIFNKNAKLLACYYWPREESKYLTSNFNNLFNEHLENFSITKKSYKGWF